MTIRHIPHRNCVVHDRICLRSRIPDETLERIRQAVPIEQVIGGHVRLQRRGKNFTGHCPFHEEKTPSFSVNPEKQLFYCFGCGVGGDVFTFVARVERTDFRGAALRLAAKVGMTIDAISPEERERQRRESARERILAQTLKDRAAKVLLDTREYLHWLLSVRRNAAKRLTAIHNCGPIEGQDEVEWQWEKLRLLANEIRHAYAAYMIAALADHAGRYSYALHPERRAEMIDAALEFGFVRGAKRGEFGGILFEVDA